MTTSSDSGTADRVLKAVDVDLITDLARGALRIPSFSGEEEGVARYFVDAMDNLGIDAELQPVPESASMPASFNALGHVGPSEQPAELMLNGHIDHNPVCSDWSVDPFGAVVRDGWLYGFVHMKSACAAYIAAAHAVRVAGVELRKGALLAMVCGELRAGLGTKHLLAEGHTSRSFILGEPTDLHLGLRHAASVVLTLHVHGSMAHYATREVAGVRAVNAVEKMAWLIPHLGRSHSSLSGKDEGGWLTYTMTPGFEGLPQLNVGPLRGGIGAEYDATRPALFPDRCSVVLDIRTVPGMSAETVVADIEDLVRRLREQDADLDVTVDLGGAQFPLPFEGRPDSPVAGAVRDAHRHITGIDARNAKELLFAASDASWLAAHGIDGVVYGPAGRYLSRPDERCELSDIVQAAEVYALAMTRLCAGDDEPAPLHPDARPTGEQHDDLNK